MANIDPKVLYADIIIDISHEALDKVFQYRVPFSLAEETAPGTRVKVPFGKANRIVEGYVIRVSEKADYDPGKIKEIIGIVPDQHGIESQLIKVAAFLKKQYGGSMSQALRTVLPVRKKMKLKKQITVSLAISSKEAENLLSLWKKRHYHARVRLFELLLEKGEVPYEEIRDTCGFSRKALEELAKRELICMSETVRYRNPFGHLETQEQPEELQEEQKKILDDFSSRQSPGTYLLHGVTGSGKTEIYLSLIEMILSEKKQAIVLIPEISLTYQTVSRFYSRFGDRIAVINSRLSEGERSDQIERIQAGEADVVIGPRSALFAPLDHLGLIIIDEEHDGAYKSELTPKYHAVDTAIYRASLVGASVVLGSATPSVESYEKALRGEYVLWEMKNRATGALLPETKIIDLRKEFREGNRSMFSRELKEEIRRCLERKEQMMLFLNRRGYAGFVSCRSCGEVRKCPHCDVSLTFHKPQKLLCHYCGHEETFDKVCPVCGLAHTAPFGLGTQKVEAALYQEFPEARVMRMDLDTTKRKHAHEKILQSFEAGEADILLGTQMIVKGHDYPNVTLVGIIAADLTLHGQDFRSAERTFQLLCQAAGRAGRGEKPGKVIIQTYLPDHYAIRNAAQHSYRGFFEEESVFRSSMHYPPYAHMMAILITSEKEEEAKTAGERIAKILANSQKGKDDPVVILGPGPARISKVKDIYRQVLYLKHVSGEVLLDLEERLAPVVEGHPLFDKVRIQFDYEPVTLY